MGRRGGRNAGHPGAGSELIPSVLCGLGQMLSFFGPGAGHEGAHNGPTAIVRLWEGGARPAFGDGLT